MTFLQPALLLALPLIAVPILIHLINQRRYQSIEWGAMPFLLSAVTMSKGYARLRRWLILAMRTLAVAGLIFAVSRPLASGWLRLAAPGRVDTTLILLDCSPSMQQQDPRTGVSKLDAARTQLLNSLGKLPSNRWVLIDSATQQPQELESLDELETVAEARGVSASTDIPALMQAAYAYLRDNRPGRCEIWVCSDLRRHDWGPGGGRWQAVREAFLEFPAIIRFHLLLYPEAPERNRSVQVESARVRQAESGRELVLSLNINQTPAARQPELPIRLDLDEAPVELTIEADSGRVELSEYIVPLPTDEEQGWGRVQLPEDENSEDNVYYFVFENPLPRKTVVVSERPELTRAWEVAAGISAERGVPAHSQTIRPQEISSVEWDDVALVVWQGGLPTGTTAELLQSLASRGTRLLFLPDETEDETGSFMGCGWGEWTESTEETRVTRWQTDQDLLANAQSGLPLSLPELRIQRYRSLRGERIPLATLEGGVPLLARVTQAGAHVYFLATTTQSQDSNLASEGVVLFVMLQRALIAGADNLGRARQRVAGEEARSVLAADSSVGGWERVSQVRQGIPLSPHLQAGVYRQGERMVAVNRDLREDSPERVTDDELAGLFEGLPYDRIDGRINSSGGLFSEIWPAFLLLMLVALLAESVLCLPKRPQAITLAANPAQAAKSTWPQTAGSNSGSGFETTAGTSSGFGTGSDASSNAGFGFNQRGNPEAETTGSQAQAETGSHLSGFETGGKNS